MRKLFNSAETFSFFLTCLIFHFLSLQFFFLKTPQGNFSISLLLFCSYLQYLSFVLLLLEKFNLFSRKLQWKWFYFFLNVSSFLQEHYKFKKWIRKLWAFLVFLHATYNKDKLAIFTQAQLCNHEKVAKVRSKKFFFVYSWTNFFHIVHRNNQLKLDRIFPHLIH